MDINYLIEVLGNRLSALHLAKDQAFSAGDLERINAIDKDIFEVENTLKQLNLLSDMKNAAAAVNSTPAEVIASGIEAIQNVPPMVQGPSASAVINGYDVSAYATDALYEEKIQKILAAMPVFNEAIDADVYIQNTAPGSPVTGDMVYAAVEQYDIDLPLLLAIMQNDSQFGTKGVGATTFNPGNVGNTGSATRSFGSWEEGVVAVAEWLSQHHGK